MMRKCWRCCSMLLLPTLALLAIVLFFPNSKRVFSALRFVKNVTEETDALVLHESTFMTSISSQHLDSNHGNQLIVNDSAIILAITLCGHDTKQEEQVIVLLKSVVLTSTWDHPIHAIIIADSEDSYLNVAQQVATWPPFTYSILTLSYIPLWYPKRWQWMKTFRTLCTTERLYYPVILKDYDLIIHLDTDTVFLRPVQELWNYLTKMNARQFISMAPEHVDPADAYYNSPLNKVPYYGKLGLNAGVILMNLNRMRNLSEQSWTASMHDVYRKYQHAPLHFADQDMLNVYFHDNPDRLLELPCNWNYRNDFCRFKGNTCPAASGEDGVGLLHGNRGVFLSSDEPTFKAIYEAFLKYNWAFDLKLSLVEPMLKLLAETRNTMCGAEVGSAAYAKFLISRYGGGE